MADAELDRLMGLSPQFSAYVIDERQVLLLSEQRSFRLTGKLYVALIPFLDGSRRGCEIVGAFAGRVAEERLRLALGTLLSKGYASYLDSSAPTGRQALWAELDVSPADAERNLADHSIAVKAMPGGSAAEGARLLRRGAAEAGIRVVPQKAASLTVVCVDDYLHRDLAAINLSMRRQRRRWTLFKAGGRLPMLGPLFGPGGGPCWACLSQRMLENRPGDRLVDGAIRAVRPARSHTGATLSLAASFAALELARSFASDGGGALERGIVSLDLKGHDRREHEVRLDAHCPVCGEPYDPAAALERGMTAVELRSQRMLPEADGGWRISSAAEVASRLGRYVSPLTGIIAELQDSSPAQGLPVFQAMQTNPAAPTSPRQNRLIGRPSAAAGKGMQEIQAKASCLGEAIERYLCGFTGREPRRRAAWASLGKAAPHPNDYLNYSERQYETRDDWNKLNDGFNWVGERFDESREIEWTPAWSLTHGERRWLPTRFCYFNYHGAAADPGGDNEFCRADSNGCASGSTLEEAILQGFFELVERDACALWWYNRLRRPAFDLDASQDPFVRRVRAHCAARDRALHVLDLTNDLGVPSAIAVSYRLADGKAIEFGLGAHFDVAIAVSRALAELNQMAAFESEFAATDDKKLSDDNRVVFDWNRNKSLDSEPYCVAEGMVALEAYDRPQIADQKEAVEQAMRIVSGKGLDMIVLDHSRPEIDFAAARVVVPGLRHFWARYRPGRLYRTPVDLGWLSQPRAEDDLNPIAFFL